MSLLIKQVEQVRDKPCRGANAGAGVRREDRARATAEMPVWSAPSAILANKALAAGLPGPPLPGTLAHPF